MPEQWTANYMQYGTPGSATFDDLRSAASFLTYGLEEGAHACVSITRPDGSTEWDHDSDESIHDVLERAPEPPETIVIPAQTVTEVKCGGCGMLLVTTATVVGMNSAGGVGAHLCHGVLIPALQLTVRTEPARVVKAPAADEDASEWDDDD
jgi:hypothetical protein